MDQCFIENGDVKKYLSVNQIPEIVESILTSAAFYKPLSPLENILENLKKIKCGDFKGLLSWDSFINEHDLPVQRVFKPCFLEAHIFDNPFVREKFHQQIIKAIEHHSRAKMKKYFGMLRVFHKERVAKKVIDRKNTILAINHFNCKLRKRFVACWVVHAKVYAANVSTAIDLLLKSISYSYLLKCFTYWRLFTKDIHWKNNYFQKQALKQSNEANSNLNQGPEDKMHGVDYISRLPKSIATQIFKYLDLKSRIACSMVCNSWHALLQDCALYTELDLTNSGFDINDVLFNNILRRHRSFLYHIKLENCSQLSIKALTNLKECRNLQDVDLSGCQIKAVLLQELGVGCPFITYLNLSYSQVDDTCFAVVAKNFPSIKYLDLSYCKLLTEAGFYYLVTNKSFKNLAHFNLSGCKVNGNCLANIGQCCQYLTSFILDCIPTLTDECISKLAATCGRLRILSLMQAVKITDKSLKFVSTNLTQLEKIFIEGNKFITDIGVANLMGLRNLRHIHIVDCLRLYDTGLKPCANLRLITVCNFTDCIRLTDRGIKHILTSPSAFRLQELSLTNCIRVGDQTVQKIVSNCPNLTYLSIAYCENITDVGLIMLAHHPKLHTLDISGCSIDDHGVGSLRQAQNLVSLSMAECNLVTDIGIERMSKVENVKSLDLSFCSNLSDYGMKMLIYERKCLTSLNIGGCKLITNGTLSSIASVCDYLLKLNISENKNITDKGIRLIRNGCKKLNYLNVSYCSKLSYEGIAKLIQNHCTVVHTMSIL